TLFTPAASGDPAAGQEQGARLHGLNATRSWCWRQIASALPAGDPRIDPAQAAAPAPPNAGRPGPPPARRCPPTPGRAPPRLRRAPPARARARATEPLNPCYVFGTGSRQRLVM